MHKGRVCTAGDGRIVGTHKGNDAPVLCKGVLHRLSRASAICRTARSSAATVFPNSYICAPEAEAKSILPNSTDAWRA